MTNRHDIRCRTCIHFDTRDASCMAAGGERLARDSKGRFAKGATTSLSMRLNDQLCGKEAIWYVPRDYGFIGGFGRAVGFMACGDTWSGVPVRSAGCDCSVIV
jgi:hypothetical protein